MWTYLVQEGLPRILNMSVAASIVVLFVMLARLLLKRAPKIFSYVLWSVVLFRLLCPVSLTAGFSLLRVTAPSVQSATDHTTAVTYIPWEGERWDLGTASKEPVQTGVPEAETPDRLPPEGGQRTVSPSEGSASGGEAGVAPEIGDTGAAVQFDPSGLLTACWLAGALGLAGSGAVSYFRLRRRLCGAVQTEQGVWIADYIPGPFVIGILRPRIYLPSTLTKREMTYILLHEKHHIRRGDHIVKLISFIVLCIHWFNPLVWAAFLLSGKDMEMSCDEAVVKRLGPQVRADYSSSLLSFATGRRIIAGTPLAFGEGNTKSRIRNLVTWRKPKGWAMAAAAVLCAAVTAACAANPLAAPLTGSYASMEDFAREAMAEVKTVSYQKADGSGTAETEVLDTRLAMLDKDGERSGLSPDGTLELWRFQYEVKIGVPAEEVRLSVNMSQEDGWFDLQGQGGEYLVALRREDGSYDVLDRQVVDGNKNFHGVYRNVSEALYTWYVATEGLDLPQYVETWTLPVALGSQETDQYQVSLYEGDSWRIYRPAAMWDKPVYTQQGVCRIRSSHQTGAILSISRREESPEAIRDALAAQGYAAAAGKEGWYVAGLEENGIHRTAYCVPAEEGSWLLETEWEEARIAAYDYTAVEPVMLQAMAESFAVDPACARIYPDQKQIREAVNRVFVDSLSWDDTWEGMGAYTVTVTHPGGETEQYTGWPMEYFNISSTPGGTLTDHFLWHLAPEGSLPRDYQYTARFSNDSWAVTAYGMENRLQLEVNGKVITLIGDPLEGTGGGSWDLLAEFLSTARYSYEVGTACSVSGNETDYGAIARQLAEQYARAILSRPDWYGQQALDVKVRRVEVFDAYYGENDPNFCFGLGLALQLDASQRDYWEAGSGLEVLPEDGWFGWGIEMMVGKEADGNWHIYGMGTGGYGVRLPYDLETDQASLPELAEMYFLTEGNTHDFRIPYRMAERSLAQVQGLLDRLEKPQREALRQGLIDFARENPDCCGWDPAALTV